MKPVLPSVLLTAFLFFTALTTGCAKVLDNPDSDSPKTLEISNLLPTFLEEGQTYGFDFLVAGKQVDERFLLVRNHPDLMEFQSKNHYFLLLKNSKARVDGVEANWAKLNLENNGNGSWNYHVVTKTGGTEIVFRLYDHR